MTIAAALTFRWEDPPPVKWGRPLGARATRPDQYGHLAAQLRSQPGRWAAVGEFSLANGTRPNSAASLAKAIRTGQTASWAPIGAFEATERRIGDVTVVYARYLQPQT